MRLPNSLFSDHVNEYCALSLTEEEKPAMWMCYAGATGFGGYAGYGGYYRKIRMFEFDMNEAKISTWKRVEFGEDNETLLRIDEQVIVDAGKPAGPTPEEVEALRKALYGDE